MTRDVGGCTEVFRSRLLKFFRRNEIPKNSNQRRTADAKQLRARGEVGAHAQTDPFPSFLLLL